MIRLRHTSALTAAVVLLLGACGGGSATTVGPAAASVSEPSAAAEAASPSLAPAASITAPPTSVPTPVPTFDLASSAAAYLAASTAANTGFAAALANLPRENATLKQLRTWGAAMAKAEVKFDEQVKAIAFPPSMTGEVTAYLLERTELATVEGKLGAAKTLGDARSGFSKASALSSAAGKIARSIRADLGLPPPPVLSN